MRKQITLTRAVEVCKLFFKTNSLGANDDAYYKQVITSLVEHGLVKIHDKDGRTPHVSLQLGVTDLQDAVCGMKFLEILLANPLNIEEARVSIAEATAKEGR